MTRTHCRHGHELTPENSFCRPTRAFVECKICQRATRRKRDRKKRAELQAIRAQHIELPPLPKPVHTWPGWMKYRKPFLHVTREAEVA